LNINLIHFKYWRYSTDVSRL